MPVANRPTESGEQGRAPRALGRLRPVRGGIPYCRREALGRDPRRDVPPRVLPAGVAVRGRIASRRSSCPEDSLIRRSEEGRRTEVSLRRRRDHEYRKLLSTISLRFGLRRLQQRVEWPSERAGKAEEGVKQELIEIRLYHSWCHVIGLGRAWYTALGHRSETYAKPSSPSISWGHSVGRKAVLAACDSRSPSRSPWQFDPGQKQRPSDQPVRSGGRAGVSGPAANRARASARRLQKSCPCSIESTSATWPWGVSPNQRRGIAFLIVA